MRLLALTALALFGTTATAQAQDCAPYITMQSSLNSHGGRVEGSAPIQDGRIELWLTPNGDWLILGVSSETGIACVLASGVDWTTPQGV